MNSDRPGGADFSERRDIGTGGPVSPTLVLQTLPVANLGAPDAPTEVFREPMKTSHDLLERIRARRLIFTVTTGLSGTSAT